MAKNKDEKMDATVMSGRGRRETGALGPNAEIGRRLRAFYRSVEVEPIPERFLDLLEKLDEAEKKAKDGK